MEPFSCECSAEPLKATTASATILFIVEVCVVIAVPAISIIRSNLEVFGSTLGVITKEHPVLEIDNNIIANQCTVVQSCSSHYHCIGVDYWCTDFLLPGRLHYRHYTYWQLEFCFLEVWYKCPEMTFSKHLPV